MLGPGVREAEVESIISDFVRRADALDPIRRSELLTPMLRLVQALVYTQGRTTPSPTEVLKAQDFVRNCLQRCDTIFGLQRQGHWPEKPPTRGSLRDID